MEVSQTNIEINNFPNICRVCLQFGEFNPLEISIFVSHTTCIDTLRNLTGIEIREDDKLPTNICNTCVKQLSDIELFIKICKCNDTYLKSLLAAEDKESLQTSDNVLYDGFEEEDSFDEIDNIALSERKLRIKSQFINKDDCKINPRNEFKTRKRKVKLRKTGKRIEECECKTCGKKFTRRGGLKRHSKTHLGIKPFECKTCGKTFVEKATLNRHFLIHTGEKPFECNLCGKMTTRKDQILEHINKHHPNAVNCDFVITEHKRSDTGRNDVFIESKNDTIINSTKEKCIAKEDSIIGNKIQSSEDEKDQTDFSFEINEDSSKIGEARPFKTKKRIEICLCNLCGKVFRRKGYLKNHMAIHAKIKPFECKICGKGFTQRHALTRHNLVHTKERPFQCNLCGKTFTRKEILMDHLKNHEEGSKPYLCFHCGKCFSNKDYLSKHLKYYLPGKGKRKTNSEEKKCICPQCGKQLHSVSYLKTHLLTHTGEKPYECNICGNRFTVLRSLNHHLNIHKGVKPYQCTQCDKAFRTSGSLRKHILLHTGERPFKCTSCEKGFIRRSHLKRHLRIH